MSFKPSQPRPCRIVATGSYLPSCRIDNDLLEDRLSLPKGWIQTHCGVETRHHAEGELSSAMAAAAAEQALQRASIQHEELDLIIGASGTMQQAIPSMGALVHKRLGLRRTATFDVNSTCMSFLTSLDLAAHLLQTGCYRTILIVSAEAASVGLNPQDPKTASLFGDGAAAAIVRLPQPDESGRCYTSSFETWSEGQDACELAGGGSRMGIPLHLQEPREDWLFRMDGPKLLRHVLPRSLLLIKRLLAEAGWTLQDLHAIVPHQASPRALEILGQKLEGFSGELINVVHRVGNMVAASLPYALDDAIVQGRLRRGERCLLLGTSAGLSVGGILLEY